MARKQYGTLPIIIDGPEPFVDAVEQVLNQVAGVPEGGALLLQFVGARHSITVVPADAGKGNSTRRGSPQSMPTLIQAIKNRDPATFQRELAVALGTARSRGITLEHVGRQLALGMTPVSYRATHNVVRPTTRIAVPAHLNGHQAMAHLGMQIMNVMAALEDFASGRRLLADLPRAWKYELPRVLRDHLQPGRGSDSRIKFNPNNHMSCALDPAMQNRPPALGLAHEMIHALHNLKGVNMNVKNGQGKKLEELITTGLPPYHFEAYSDNKLRALWNVGAPVARKPIAMRMKY